MHALERLDNGETWLRDQLSICATPGFCEVLEVDMSRAAATIAGFRERHMRVTYTHLFIQAAAAVLRRHPDLHQLIAGRERLLPDRVRISLCAASAKVLAPVICIDDADRKSLPEIAAEVQQRVPQALDEQRRLLDRFRTWGWLVPIRRLRHCLLRTWLRRARVRWEFFGALQITCVPTVDQVIPFITCTTAILGIGQVRERVICSAGKAVVRPTALLTCGADHGVWDGLRGARFLLELKRILETPPVDEETICHDLVRNRVPLVSTAPI